MSLVVLIIILFQAYCFYQIYQNQDKAYWYIIILLFPFIGGLIYFIRNASEHRDFALNPSNVAPVFSNSRITQLEKQVELTDTVSNKISLADAYVENGEYENAINLYHSCFNKFTEDDDELNEKLLAAYYLSSDFINSIALGKKLEDYKFFANAKEKTYYAWAYFELNDDHNAERIFQQMNIPNTNYYHRSEYAKFLIETEKPDEANVLLDEMLMEYKEMDAYEKKSVHSLHKEIKTIKQRVLR